MPDVGGLGLRASDEIILGTGCYENGHHVGENKKKKKKKKI